MCVCVCVCVCVVAIVCIHHIAQNFGGTNLWWEKNFGGFGTATKLMEKILVASHTNNSSLFECTRTYNIWRIKVW